MRPILPWLLTAVLTVFSMSCGPAPQRLPDRVNIALIDATVGPAMANGKAWDGPGKISIDVLRSVSQALARIPARGRAEDVARTGAVLAELTAAVAAAITPPDP
ncbi:MAG: hypothetical protein RMJ98_20050, partial [Myxococcales bacterium]|nr:hypothetical protein [Polyangiaceae bacterium]MDW8251594.1 hypothetical protein [Myxococcales bacterium]